MSIFQFSELKYVKTFEDDEEIRLGSFKNARDAQLGNVRVNIVIENFGELLGTEQMQMQIYTNPEITDSIYTSNTVSLSDITFDTSNPSKTAFIGFLRFDFDDEHLNDQLTYYPTVTISGYTRTTTLVIGLAYDFPDPVYDNGESDFFAHPIAMQIYDKTVKQV